MPFQISKQDGFLVASFFGVVTASDLNDLANAVEKIENNATIIPNRLTDLTCATGMELRFPDVMTLAMRRKSRPFPNQFKSAIVAAQPIHVGFARMFQTLNDHPQIAIRIFAEMDEAHGWLRVI